MNSIRMRMWVLAALVATVVAVVAEARADDARPKTNVVIILADDLGVGDVSCYGSTHLETPTLDRLASQGVRFTDAHSTTSVCTPSRYTMLTGRYYWRIKRRWNWDLLIDEGQPTIASIHKSAGYATGCFGKWHLGFCREEPDYNKSLEPGPLEVGFDYYFGTPRSHNEPPMVFVENHDVVGLDPADPIVMVSAKDTPKGKGWGHGISTGAKAAHAARPEDQIDLIVTRKATEWITANKDRPFFAYLALVAPHVPLSPAREFRNTGPLGPYGDFIRQMDHCVGEVLATLDKHGLADDTLVVFSSDNGAIYHDSLHALGHRANLSYLGQKTDAWEGGHRVPFIVRWPGRVPEGRVCDRLLSMGDMLATVCAATGVERPAKSGPDSLNQLPVWLDPDAPAVRNEMVYHGIYGLALRFGDDVFLPKQGSFGVTTDPKMAWAMQFEELGLVNSDYNADGTVKPDAPPVQLYDLEGDPSQSVNRAGSEPAVVKKLAARLEEIRNEDK